MRHLLPLFHHLINEDCSADSLASILQYVRDNRLPKTKTISWLTENNIFTDLAFGLEVILPFTQRMTQGHDRMMAQHASLGNS
jgi:hypothetical protein